MALAWPLAVLANRNFTTDSSHCLNSGCLHAVEAQSDYASSRAIKDLTVAVMTFLLCYAIATVRSLQYSSILYCTVLH